MAERVAMTADEIIAALDSIHAEMESMGWTDTEAFNMVGCLLAKARGQD